MQMCYMSACSYVRKLFFQKYKKKIPFGNTFRDTYSNLTSAPHVYLLHILANWMMITYQFCLSNFIWFKFIHSFFLSKSPCGLHLVQQMTHKREIAEP